MGYEVWVQRKLNIPYVSIVILCSTDHYQSSPAEELALKAVKIDWRLWSQVCQWHELISRIARVQLHLLRSLLETLSMGLWGWIVNNHGHVFSLMLGSLFLVWYFDFDGIIWFWQKTVTNFLVPDPRIFVSMSIIIAKQKASISALWDSCKH